jgi:O-acetyl-ADP-ribose deacetylase (regulator of RNase III)
MTDELKIKNSSMRLQRGDITDLEIQSFVFYAQHNLALGSGYGTAISVRGGPSIQEELKGCGSLRTTEAVVTKAGGMKSEYIIHAVGPRFQEEDTEKKLKATVLASLKCAEEKHIESIAFPAMGTGFYGIPLDVSARVTLETIREYLSKETAIKDVVICLQDAREYKPFQATLSAMKNPEEGGHE